MVIQFNHFAERQKLKKEKKKYGTLHEECEIIFGGLRGI